MAEEEPEEEELPVACAPDLCSLVQGVLEAAAEDELEDEAVEVGLEECELELESEVLAGAEEEALDEVAWDEEEAVELDPESLSLLLSSLCEPVSALEPDLESSLEADCKPDSAPD